MSATCACGFKARDEQADYTWIGTTDRVDDPSCNDQVRLVVQRHMLNVQSSDAAWLTESKGSSWGPAWFVYVLGEGASKDCTSSSAR